MKKASRRGLSRLFALVLTAAQSGAALACGYDGASIGAILAKFPLALTVANALRDPANVQLLDQQLVAPTFVNMVGYHRAVRRLQQLREGLESVVLEEAATAPPFSLMLVELGLWTRYAFDAEGVSIMIYTNGPRPNDLVVFTAEAVIEAIAAGRLSTDEAFRRRLIIIDGPENSRRQVAAILRQGIAARGGRL